MTRLKGLSCILCLFLNTSLFFFCTEPVRPNFSDYSLSFVLYKDSTGIDTLKQNSILYYEDVVNFTIKLETPHQITGIELILKDSIGNELYTDTSETITSSDTIIPLGTTSLLTFGTNKILLNFTRFDTTLDTIISFTVMGVAPVIGNNKMIDTLGQNIVDSLFCLYFSVTAGTKPLTYTWYKDGAAYMPGKFQDTLRFSPIAFTDLGSYKCLVENEWGKDSTEPYNLNLIHSAPSILNGKLIQASGIPEADSSFFLFVKASGSEPLQYKWSHNGILMIGQINDTIFFDSLGFSDTGAYVCSLSNLWGADVSIPYNLQFGNKPPQWTIDTLSDTICEGELYTISLIDSCSDPDNDIIEFTLLPGKPDSDTVSALGTYHYTPTFFDSGNFHVTVLAGDGIVLTPCVLSLTVTNKNRKPVFRDSLPALSYRLFAGETLNVSFLAVDPDSDAVTYSLGTTTLPHPNSISFTDSLMVWKSEISDSGRYTVSVLASDGIDTAVAMVDVAVGASFKLPPNITIGDYTTGDTIKLLEMQTLICTVSVTDPDPGDLPILGTPLNKPDSAHFEITTGILTYRPNFQVSSRDSNKTFANVTFTASDNSAPSLSDTFIVHLEVVDSNTAPELNPITGETVGEGDLISFDLSASDINGDSIFLAITSKPAGAVFVDSGNGKGSFYWQTNGTDSGTYNIIFSVNDGELIGAQYATFIVQPKFLIIRTSSGGGYISDLGGTLEFDTNWVDPGLAYEMKALAFTGAGYKFSNWSGDVSDTTVTDTTLKGVFTTDFTVHAEFVRQVMVEIPAKNSSFQMGQSGIADPVHAVNFTYNYWMDTTEVTQKDYESLMKFNPSSHKKDFLPVHNATWFDAVLYCNMRSKADTLDTVYIYRSITGTPGNGCADLGLLKIDFSKNGYRLPTEAEWEYACRAGTTTLFYWGNDTSMVVDSQYAILTIPPHYINQIPRKVGTKRPNNFGLYDMIGNVFEECNDWFDVYSGSPQTNPTGPVSSPDKKRVVRGGHHSDRIYYSAGRSSLPPDVQHPLKSFRVVRPRVNPF